MTSDKTKIALRVLTAISNREVPNEKDVSLLRNSAPINSDLDPDELAYVVIEEAIVVLQEAMERMVKLRVRV